MLVGEHEAAALRAAPSLSRAQLRSRILRAAVADGQGGARATGVRWYLKYCVLARNVSPISGLKASSSDAAILERETLVMDFIIWLLMARPSGRHISIETALKYLSQVKAWHRRTFRHELLADVSVLQLKELAKGLKRLIPQKEKRVRYGVRTQDLARAMDLAFPGRSPDELMWRALLSVAFCGLMRGAEVAVAEGDAFAPLRHLTRADVDFFTEVDGTECAEITMRVAKRVGASKTTKVILGGGGSLVDAVRELKRYVDSFEDDGWPASQTPLFAFASTKKAVGVASVRGMVKALMASLGYDPRTFGAHSLRIGGASAAFAAGIEPSAIRLAGRWSSDVYEIYVRLSRQAASRLGRVIGSSAFEDLERGEFISEELELRPLECNHEAAFEDADLMASTEWI